MPRPSTLALAVLACAALPLVASCAAAAQPPSATPPLDAAVTVVNCGVEVSFDAAPERVVTIKSTSTEMLLALGLGDRIVGMAFQDGPVPERWADQAARIPVIADRLPSEEAVLALAPDLVYAGWESNLTADGVGARDELASFGVAGYVQPAACQSAGRPERIGFDEIFREVEEVGRIFRVEDAAAALVAEQRRELTRIVPASGTPTALWWSSGTDTPYVGGGAGAPQLLMTTAGLTNIAAGIDQSWGSYSWEAIIAADPDVLVLVDADWNTARHKIDYLESDPATAAMSAVQHSRYVIVPFPASEAGVRSVEAAGAIAERMAELGW